MNHFDKFNPSNYREMKESALAYIEKSKKLTPWP